MKGTNNRLDNVEVIAHLLADVYTSVSGLNTHEMKKDLRKIRLRSRHEGIAFFTKTLPTLGKAIDLALLGQRPLDVPRYRKIPGTRLPKLFGELFKRVFSSDGTVLKEPCVDSIRVLRDLTFIFYKYEIPCAADLSNAVIDTFVKNEEEIKILNCVFGLFANYVNASDLSCSARADSDRHISYRETFIPCKGDDELTRLVRAMRKEGHKLFSTMDITDIWPNHGPGAVATRETNEEKYRFTRYSPRLDSVFPFTTYFVPSQGWIEHPSSLDQLDQKDPPARVILVPKDSRGPRLISCEPLENQWIQQGIKSLLVKHLESHRETHGHVNFTDQGINRSLAMLGSINGDYATLDLKEASDRVCHNLVRSIFPNNIFEIMDVCRTTSTQLPDGRVINLAKFAPMGSALCFPILASVVWLALTAGSDACSRKTTYVYGDDIIVHRTDVPNAIKRLELVGLKVNVNKSCTSGFFRESCGFDAYKGHQVTPFRLRKVWDHHPQSTLYVSYIEKSNEAYHRGYHKLANYLASKLISVYGKIPYSTDPLTAYDALNGVPHLTWIPTQPRLTEDPIPPQGEVWFQRKSYRYKLLQRKLCKKTQRLLYRVTALQPVTVISRKPNLNYFRALSRKTLSNEAIQAKVTVDGSRRRLELKVNEPMRSDVYTNNRASKLVRMWR